MNTKQVNLEKYYRTNVKYKERHKGLQKTRNVFG